MGRELHMLRLDGLGLRESAGGAGSPLLAAAAVQRGLAFGLRRRLHLRALPFRGAKREAAFEGGEVTRSPRNKLDAIELV